MVDSTKTGLLNGMMEGSYDLSDGFSLKSFVTTKLESVEWPKLELPTFFSNNDQVKDGYESVAEETLNVDQQSQSAGFLPSFWRGMSSLKKPILTNVFGNKVGTLLDESIDVYMDGNTFSEGIENVGELWKNEATNLVDGLQKETNFFEDGLSLSSFYKGAKYFSDHTFSFESDKNPYSFSDYYADYYSRQSSLNLLPNYSLEDFSFDVNNQDESPIEPVDNLQDEEPHQNFGQTWIPYWSYDDIASKSHDSEQTEEVEDKVNQIFTITSADIVEQEPIVIIPELSLDEGGQATIPNNESGLVVTNAKQSLDNEGENSKKEVVLYTATIQDNPNEYVNDAQNNESNATTIVEAKSQILELSANQMLFPINNMRFVEPQQTLAFSLPFSASRISNEYVNSNNTRFQKFGYQNSLVYSDAYLPDNLYAAPLSFAHSHLVFVDQTNDSNPFDFQFSVYLQNQKNTFANHQQCRELPQAGFVMIHSGMLSGLIARQSGDVAENVLQNIYNNHYSRSLQTVADNSNTPGSGGNSQHQGDSDVALQDHFSDDNQVHIDQLVDLNGDQIDFYPHYQSNISQYIS